MLFWTPNWIAVEKHFNYTLTCRHSKIQRDHSNNQPYTDYIKTHASYTVAYYRRWGKTTKWSRSIGIASLHQESVLEGKPFQSLAQSNGCNGIIPWCYSTCTFEEVRSKEIRSCFQAETEAPNRCNRGWATWRPAMISLLLLYRRLLSPPPFMVILPLPYHLLAYVYILPFSK